MLDEVQGKRRERGGREARREARAGGQAGPGRPYIVRNIHLKKVLAKHGRDDDDTWTSITVTKGSVQHLDFLTDQERATFKTAFELDQRWVIEHAADRTPFICQSQSVNVFLPADVHKRDLHQIHMTAWKKGLKSLYYCRSLSIQRADTISAKVVGQSDVMTLHKDEEVRKLVAAAPPSENENDYEECLACQ